MEWVRLHEASQPIQYHRNKKLTHFFDQMNKEDLIAVFKDTQAQVENQTVLGNSVTTKHEVSEISTVTNNGYDTVVKTINADTVSAAREYAGLGKTCVLNMASAKHAGGGVVNGAKAQEECLFRCSNLFETVVQEYYPLSYLEGLYTTDAIFFKDAEYKNIVPFAVDVATVAAVNLNPNARYDDQRASYEVDNYEKVTRDKIRLILYLANQNHCENIILGAWGCGVFKNDPTTISKLFKEVVDEHKGCFKNVIFAVINDHNSAGDNYTIFDATFNA